MPRVVISQAQHESTEPGPPASPWRALLDAELARVKQWQAASDLLAEQVAEQGAATLGAGVRLWRDTLVTGWDIGRQWRTVQLDAWRRAAELLRR